MNIKSARLSLSARAVVMVTLLGISLGCDGFLTSLDDFGYTPSPYDTSEQDVPVADILPIIVDPVVYSYMEPMVASNPELRRRDIVSFSIYGGTFATLEDFRLFPHIDFLVLEGIGLADASGNLTLSLEPLRDLNGLRFLHLSSNNLRDSTLSQLPVESWQQFQNLVLHDNLITDLNAVAALVNRTVFARSQSNRNRIGIRLDGNTIDPATMGAMSGMSEQLSGISISGQAFIDLNWIPADARWGFLDIQGSSALVDVSGLANLVGINSLYIGDSPKILYDSAKQITTLETLSARNMQPSLQNGDLLGIASGSTNLHTIELSRNTGITSLNNLTQYPMLRGIEATELQSVTSIGGIGALTRLERIDLSNNPNLTEGVAELALLQNLQWIYLQGIGLDNSHPDIQAVIVAHGATANELYLPSGELYVPPSP